MGAMKLARSPLTKDPLSMGTSLTAALLATCCSVKLVTLIAVGALTAGALARTVFPLVLFGLAVMAVNLWRRRPGAACSGADLPPFDAEPDRRPDGVPVAPGPRAR